MARTVTNLQVTELTVAPGNFDTSRGKITTIVIHTMVGNITGSNMHFNTAGSKVSAHYGIGEDGSIVHWVDEDKTAYHAGNYAVNQTSIGIEHEDRGDANSIRTDALYESSSQLVRDICDYYGIPLDRQYIIKHNEVSGAHTDCPGNLDIDRIINGAKQVYVNTASQPHDGSYALEVPPVLQQNPETKQAIPDSIVNRFLAFLNHFLKG